MNIEIIKNTPTTQRTFSYDEWERLAEIIILAYCNLLKKWRKAFCPTSEKEACDSRYLESVKKLDYVWILYHRFMNGSKAERLAMKDEIEKIEQRLYRYHRSCIACTGGVRYSVGM